MEPLNDRRELTQDEYDFSGIKNKPELTACYWWEYGRESRALHREVAAVSQQILQSKEAQSPSNLVLP